MSRTKQWPTLIHHIKHQTSQMNYSYTCQHLPTQKTKDSVCVIHTPFPRHAVRGFPTRAAERGGAPTGTPRGLAELLVDASVGALRGDRTALHMEPLRAGRIPRLGEGCRLRLRRRWQRVGGGAFGQEELCPDVPTLFEKMWSVCEKGGNASYKDYCSLCWWVLLTI